MKKNILMPCLAGLLLPMAASAEMFSVNIWSPGKPPAPTVWSEPENMLTLTLEAEEEAGAPGWETVGWENVTTHVMREGRPNPFAGTANPVTLTGSAGSSATFEIVNQRNMGPYLWNEVRDDSDAVHVGNATLLDGHSNSTEWDGADGGGSAFPFRVFDGVVTDIPFPAYDVVIYFGGNQGQFGGGGCNIRINGEIPEDPADKSGAMKFKIRSGQPDGTLVEITGEDEPGNYIVYTGLSGPTLRIQTWGDGFSHLGPAGFQIRSATPARFPLTITPAVAPATGYDLEWESIEGKLYNLRTSLDLDESIAAWDLVAGDLEATPPANVYNVETAGPRRFYAVEEFDAPPPPPLLVENFEDVVAPALPAGWSRSDNGAGTVWETGSPAGGEGVPSAAAVGLQCVGTNVNGKYTANADASLITPVFTVPDGGATLVFWQYIDTEVVPSNDSGSIRLLNAADNSVLADIATGITGTTEAWSQQTVDLPAAANGVAVKIEFRFTSDAVEHWGGFYIDDVLVTAN